MMMSKLMLREGNEETVLDHNFDGNRNILTQDAPTEENSKPESTRLRGRRNQLVKMLTLLITKE